VDPKQVVAAGYDAIAERYEEWAASFESPVMAWVGALLERLEPGSDVLDLGCGNGLVTRVLAERHRVTGVDISAAQLERARAKVPAADFFQADATVLELPVASFDAVVSTFVLGHVPRAEQPPLLRRIHGWLRPGGWFVGTLGLGGSDDVVEPDWLGAPMFFASFDEETNLRLLAEAGLEVERARVVPFEEPGHGRVSFQWVLARRAGS
jgi:ubiquinone/menaquinone biosynthesis C-methylase UbiE